MDDPVQVKVNPGEYLSYHIEVKANELEDSIVLAVDQYRHRTGLMPKVAQLSKRHEVYNLDLSDIGLTVRYIQGVPISSVELGPE